MRSWRASRRACGHCGRRRCRSLIPTPPAATSSRARWRPSITRRRWRAPSELIRAGRIEKIVLAREVDVHGPGRHDVAAVYGVLREAFTGCFVYAVGRGEATFIGATPELLLRRSGLRVSTLALAGSVGRSADPAVDDHLGERLMRSGEGPRGARDRRAPDRADVAPGLRVGDPGRGARGGADREHPASSRPRSGRSWRRRWQPWRWPGCCTRRRRWVASPRRRRCR